jgi:shikimate kinase
MNSLSNIILIGSMGAGKTTNGKWLAKQLGKTFVDLDAFIEQNTGTSISHIFELEGEAGFRIRESAALAEVLANDNQVLATGGGAVLLPENRMLMNNRGVVVFLNIPPEMQLQRLLKDTKRPLMQTADRALRLKQLADERTPIYLNCADIQLNLGTIPLSQIRHTLLRLISNYEPSPDNTCTN